MSVQSRLSSFDNDKYAISKVQRTYVDMPADKMLSPDLFEFYILQDRYYKNSNIASYNLMCQIKGTTNKFLILGVVKGTKEEAIAKLKEMVFADKEYLNKENSENEEKDG